MQPRTCLLTAFAAIAFGVAAMAADLPKEGTFSGTDSGTGTFKTYPVEKERTLFLWEASSFAVPSVPMMMRHLPPGSLDPKARKDFLIHAHATHTE